MSDFHEVIRYIRETQDQTSFILSNIFYRKAWLTVIYNMFFDTRKSVVHLSKLSRKMSMKKQSFCECNVHIFFMIKLDDTTNRTFFSCLVELKFSLLHVYNFHTLLWTHTLHSINSMKRISLKYILIMWKNQAHPQTIVAYFTTYFSHFSSIS